MNNLTDFNQKFRQENEMAFRMQKHSLHFGKCSITNKISVNYSA